MGVIKWVKKTAGKADETLDQVKTDLNSTATKVQEVLNDSSKNVRTVINIVGIALLVSIFANIVTISLNINNHKREKEAIVIHNLYLGGKSLHDISKKK